MTAQTHGYGPLADTLGPDHRTSSGSRVTSQLGSGQGSFSESNCSHHTFANNIGPGLSGLKASAEQKAFARAQKWLSDTMDPSDMCISANERSAESGSQTLRINNTADKIKSANSLTRNLQTQRRDTPKRNPVCINMDVLPCDSNREHEFLDAKLSQAEPTKATDTLAPRQARHQMNKGNDIESTGNRIDSHHDQGEQEGWPKSRTQRYREKNKLAAAKCRARKRQQIKNTESRCSHYSAVNAGLRMQVRYLTEELNGTRVMALSHQDCGCPVTRYNSHQVSKMARDTQALSPQRG